MDNHLFIEEKKMLISFVENFHSIIWKEGCYSAMCDFIERIGNKYSKDKTQAFKKLKLFNDEEIRMFLDLENFILEYLEKDYPFWICFSATEFDEFNKLRKIIINHFNVNESFD